MINVYKKTGGEIGERPCERELVGKGGGDGTQGTWGTGGRAGSNETPIRSMIKSRKESAQQLGPVCPGLWW